MNPVDWILAFLALVFTTFAAWLGWLSNKRGRYIQTLKEENAYLQKRINRVTSKVDPESDKALIEGAAESIQIIDINALGPLHHAREELMSFLEKRGGKIQIVLLDPESEAFRRRVADEGDDGGRLESEWIAALSIIRDIERRSDRSVDLRLYSTYPDRYLLAADCGDKLSKGSKMLISYYPKKSGTRGYSGEQFLAEYPTERDRDSFEKNYAYISDRLREGEQAKVEHLLVKSSTRKATS